MKAYLAQHGKALDKESDSTRPLTPEGAREVETVAAVLEGRMGGLSKIWHSGKMRAQQTADILARRVAPRLAPKARDGLAPKDDVKSLASELASMDKDVLIVGHLPFLARLAGLLLVSDEDAVVIGFHCGGVTCLERDDLDGCWRIVWAVTPEFAKKT